MSKNINKLWIFIDYANMISSCKKIWKNLDFKKLVVHLENKFNWKAIFKSIYYAYPKPWTRENGYDYSKIHNIATFLKKQLSFHIKKKVLKKIELRDNNENIIKDEKWNNKYIEKWNLDIELTMDIMQKWENFDALIIFSWDSDFKCLLEFLIWKQKKVYVFSTTWNISSELKNHSSKYYDIKNFPEDIFI